MTKQKALSRKAQGEETRAILISTGARLFAKNGYHGVSMRTLAAEAEVNLATVGYHFGGKQGLYEAIFQEIIEIRDEIFPTVEEIQARMKSANGDPQAIGLVVDWYMKQVVHGMLGKEEHRWPAFLISREMAQHTEIFPKLEKEFLTPTFDSLKALVFGCVAQGTDDEEVLITAHCIIGILVKFLEGYEMITGRLGWESYEGHGLEKITVVLSKRMRGFLGLPMENA